MKLNRAGKNPLDMMIAIDDDNGKKLWYAAEKEAYNVAKQLNEGDEVEIKIGDSKRKEMSVITFIKKVGTTGTPAAVNSNSPKCSKCGYALKDDKYDKCYLCNQKAKNDDAVENFSSDAPKCSDCGKALKDAKYSKCYLCNQKTKENKTTVEKTTTDSPKCIDCGKELKDTKYSKCYLCNQKNPVKTEKKTTYTLSTQESIERQNVNNAVSRSLIALQGQINLNTIGDVIDMLWEKFYSKLK